MLVTVLIAALVVSMMGFFLRRKKYRLRTRLLTFICPWIVLFLVVASMSGIGTAVLNIFFFAMPGLPSQTLAYWITYSLHRQRAYTTRLIS